MYDPSEMFELEQRFSRLFFYIDSLCEKMTSVFSDDHVETINRLHDILSDGASRLERLVRLYHESPDEEKPEIRRDISKVSKQLSELLSKIIDLFDTYIPSVN